MIEKKRGLSMNAHLFLKAVFGNTYRAGTDVPIKDQNLTERAWNGLDEAIQKDYVSTRHRTGYYRIIKDIPQTVSWKSIRNRNMLATFQLYREPSLLDQPLSAEDLEKALRTDLAFALTHLAQIQLNIATLLNRADIFGHALNPALEMDCVVRGLNSLGATRVMDDALNRLNGKI